jgi:hypothetical protein
VNCPSCQTDGAYVGATSVECPRLDCRHFSYRQAEEVAKKIADEIVFETIPTHTVKRILDFFAKGLGRRSIAPGSTPQTCRPS